MERALYELNRFDNDITACYFEPQLVAAGAEPVGAWLGMANYDRAMFIIQGGDWTNIGDQLDAGVMQATSAAGAGTKAIAGKTITTYTSTATNENNIWYIHVDISELDVDGGYAWIQLYVTLSANDSVYLAAICQRESRVFEPVPTTNVTEIVN
jgi:hypothetical protein